jgi:hypothetical protein
MIRTIPDLAAGKGVVASPAAFREAATTVDHLMEVLKNGSDHTWMHPEPLMWVREDGLVLDATKDVWHENRVQVRRASAGTVSAPVPAISKLDDPAPIAAHLLRLVGAALGAARPGVVSPWRVPPSVMIELHEAFTPGDHSHVRFTHPSAVSPSGVQVNGVRARGSDAGVIARLREVVPDRPCRVVTRSRNGRGNRNGGSMSSVELVAPTTSVDFRELDAISMMRLHAAAAGSRR